MLDRSSTFAYNIIVFWTKEKKGSVGEWGKQFLW